MAASDARPALISRKEAQARGLKTYFTGKKCRNGHCAARYVHNWQCVQCYALWHHHNQHRWRTTIDAWRSANGDRVRQKDAEWYARNAERVRAYGAQWYRENYERARATRSAYYWANREKRLAFHAAWYLANRERKLAREALRRKNNPGAGTERMAAWRTANPDRVRQANAARRTLRLSAGGSYTIKETRELLAVQHYRCANPYCRANLRTARRHLDHIIALARGGSNDIGNLQWLCARCNQSKNASDFAEWLHKQQKRTA